jgi:hypothetical protein
MPPATPQAQKQPQGKAEAKSKERRVVGEGDDTIVVEDSSNDEDEETLQQCFQLRSMFRRAGMPDVPVEELAANLDEDVPLQPRKPRNTVHNCAVKKLKVSEDTRLKVGAITSVVEYPVSSLLLTGRAVATGNPLPRTNRPC